MENLLVPIIMGVVLAAIALRNVYVGVRTLRAEPHKRGAWHEQPPILLGVACTLGTVLFLTDFSIRRNGAYPSNVELGIELALAGIVLLLAGYSWLLTRERRKNL